MANFGEVNNSTSLIRHLIISGNQFRKGGTAPTDATIGTSPQIPVLLFDATNELVSLFFEFPDEMDKTVSSRLTLIVALSAVEINADTLDVTVDYTVPILNSTGNGIARASTQILEQTTVTTANGLAIGDLYTIELEIVAGDATNPTASGLGLALELHLTNITEVGEFHLVGSFFEYIAKY